MRFFHPKRWSLQKRSLIVAACAVGVTAVVIAAIFTYALVRLYVSEEQTAQMRIGSAALHMVEDEIEARMDEIASAGGNLELLVEPADLQALLAEVQFGKNGYIWIGLSNARDVVTVSTGGMLVGQRISPMVQSVSGSAPFIGWLDEAHPLYAALHASGIRDDKDLLVITRRIAGHGQLTAVFRAGLSESTISVYP